MNNEVKNVISVALSVTVILSASVLLLVSGYNLFGNNSGSVSTYINFFINFI